MTKFTIRTQDVKDGIGGICFTMQGEVLGNPGAVCSLAGPAQHLKTVLAAHLSGWPAALAHVTDPVESFKCVHEAYAGESPLPYAVQRDLGRLVLTNNLGPTFDGIFVIVRPGPPGREDTVFLVHDRDGAPKAVAVSSAEYRAEAERFIARFAR